MNSKKALAALHHQRRLTLIEALRSLPESAPGFKWSWSMTVIEDPETRALIGGCAAGLTAKIFAFDPREDGKRPSRNAASYLGIAWHDVDFVFINVQYGTKPEDIAATLELINARYAA